MDANVEAHLTTSDKVKERTFLRLLLGMDANGSTPHRLAQHAGTQVQGNRVNWVHILSLLLGMDDSGGTPHNLLTFFQLLLGMDANGSTTHWQDQHAGTQGQGKRE